MRLALKIAYDGRVFHGFARQPALRTVEGEVRLALAKSRLVEDVDAANVRGSSRTDAGVSAIGNAIAFDTNAGEDEAIGRFNDAAKDVWAWASAALLPGFDPRRALSRWYRYHLTDEHDAAKLGEIGQVFVGTHEYAVFASPDARGTRRHVDTVEVLTVEDGILVDVRAHSFLRGMVRRIVAGMVAVERGDADLEALRAALREGAGHDFGTLPPEPLTLMDVDLGLPFRPAVDRATREQIRARASHARRAARFWREAAARLDRAPGHRDSRNEAN